MTEHFTRRRGFAALGTIALGAGMLFASGSAAFGAPAEPGNIDDTAPTSLTVHKYEEQGAGAATGHPSGTPDPGFSKPVEGVVFTAYPLLDSAGKTVDLLTNEGWVGLDGATFNGTSCAAPAGYTIDKDKGVALPATDVAGLATAGLPIGAYVVCETDAPQTVIKRAAPFLVTVPFPDGQNGWIYDVHVYPKNQLGSFEKTIEDQTGLGLGAPVDFTITSTVPDIGDKVWTAFNITDTLDPRLAPADPAAIVVSPAGAPATVSVDKVNGRDRVIVSITDNDWLKANVGEPVEITVKTTVASVGDGAIKNTADQWVNNPGLDPNDKDNPPTTTPEVTTNWGDVELLKIASDSAKTPLAGAEFQVFEATVPYPATANDCAIASGSTPISFVIGGQSTTTVTSGADGRVKIPGLYVSDSKNDPKDAQFRCYVVVETKAPAGYITPTGDAAKHAIAVNIGANTADMYDSIVNTQQDVPELPLTGAAGQVLLILASLSAAGIAGGLILVNRSRQKAATE